MKMEPLCISPTGLKSPMILICRVLMTLLVRLMCRYVKRARYHVNCFVGQTILMLVANVLILVKRKSSESCQRSGESNRQIFVLDLFHQYQGLRNNFQENFGSRALKQLSKTNSITKEKETHSRYSKERSTISESSRAFNSALQCTIRRKSSITSYQYNTDPLLGVTGKATTGAIAAAARTNATETCSLIRTMLKKEVQDVGICLAINAKVMQL